MIEEKLEIIEKKIDLLYRIIFGLQIPSIGHIYHRRYLNNFIGELTPLFNLSVEKEKMDGIPTQSSLNTLETELTKQLRYLENEYKHGDFLAKDVETLKGKIGGLKDNIKNLEKISKYCIKFREKREDLYNFNLFIDLWGKLGFSEEYDSYSFRKILRDIDKLKTNIKELSEKCFDGTELEVH